MPLSISQDFPPKNPVRRPARIPPSFFTEIFLGASLKTPSIASDWTFKEKLLLEFLVINVFLEECLKDFHGEF